MQTGYEIVIVDTSCFILLDKIGEFGLLKSLFKSVVTTSAIAEEFGTKLPEWINVRNVLNIHFQVMLDVDPGEASAIALALESEPSLLILDDHKARKAARRLNLNYTGTLGIFLKAKQAGLVPSVKSILEKVQHTNFRYSNQVFHEILLLAGE
jgi:predicted nucleic acid-binding protein